MSAAAVAPPPTVAAPSATRALRTLVVRGLRDNRRAPLVWGGVLGALCSLIVALWPSIEDSVDELVGSYPEGLKEAFGIRELDTVEAYLDAEMLSLVVPVALAYFTMRCVVRATVAREERGHLDVLLALPVSRSVLAIASYVVAGVTLVAILAVVWAMTWIVGAVAGIGLDAGTLAAGLLNVWPLAMVFGALAVVAVGVLHRPGRVSGVTAGLLGAMYVVDLVGRLADGLEPLRYLSAFRWYGSAIQDGLDPAHIGGLVAAGVLLTVAGAALFERRDIS